MKERREGRESVWMYDDHRFCLVTATELLSHLVSVPVLQLMVQPVSPAGPSQRNCWFTGVHVYVFKVMAFLFL